MNMKKRMLTAILTLALALSCLALPAMSIEPTEAVAKAPSLVVTEVCFNPTYKANDVGLSDTADVLEYVEIANRSDEAVPLSGITLRSSTKGYDGTFKTDPVLSVPDENTTVLQPGEVAVIAVYTDDAFEVGLHYETEAERRAFYQFFVDFYQCAAVLPEDRFFIATGYSSQTGKKLSNGFKLTNSDESRILRVADKDGATICEAAFSPLEWNRNSYAINFTYRPGADSEHPLATQPMNLGGTTPGILRDNQLSTEGMIPTGETVSVKVMDYNICATTSEQKKPNGVPVSRNERWARVISMIEAETPDVIGLCEVNHLWLDKLEGDLTGEDDAYDAYGRSSQGNTYGTEFNAIGDKTWDLFNMILWRRDKYDLVKKGTFWCSSNPDRVGSFTWSNGVTGDFARAINWVILKDKTTGAEFFFLCAHIDAKVAAARDKSAELILSKATELADGRPIAMVGDWNSNENRTSYDILTGEGFADARYRVADPTQMTLYGTGNSWGVNMNPKDVAAIDHCIITPQNVFVNKATCDRGILEGTDGLVVSDHNAIILELAVTVDVRESETESDSASESESVTESATESVTESGSAAETVTETDAVSETLVESEPSTGSTTDPDATGSETGTGGGCGALLSAGAVGVLLAAAAGAVVLKKKKD